MSTVTNNLGLIIPALSDNGKQTIIDIGTNMQKIDAAIDVYIDEIPTSGDWEADEKRYLRNRTMGSYVGIINLQTGRAAPVWESLHPYTTGEEILPNVNNGHYYKCIQSGHSAPSEPLWQVTTGSQIEDTRYKETWQPTNLYALGDIIVPTISNDRFYVCVFAGTSGGAEPIWSTTNGTPTIDGGVQWETYRIVVWEESGASANFRPFGKIE